MGPSIARDLTTCQLRERPAGDAQKEPGSAASAHWSSSDGGRPVAVDDVIGAVRGQGQRGHHHVGHGDVDRPGLPRRTGGLSRSGRAVAGAGAGAVAVRRPGSPVPRRSGHSSVRGRRPLPSRPGLSRPGRSRRRRSCRTVATALSRSAVAPDRRRAGRRRVGRRRARHRAVATERGIVELRSRDGGDSNGGDVGRPDSGRPVRRPPGPGSPPGWERRPAGSEHRRERRQGVTATVEQSDRPYRTKDESANGPRLPVTASMKASTEVHGKDVRRRTSRRLGTDRPRAERWSINDLRQTDHRRTIRQRTIVDRLPSSG